MEGRLLIFPCPRQQRGNALFDRENYQGAEHAFSAALLLEESAALYANRAISRMRLGKWEEALSDCREVLRLDPKHAKAHARMGRCFFELGQFVDADLAYNRAAEIDPNLKELQSRWRLDSALNKIAKNKDPPALLKVRQTAAFSLLSFFEFRPSSFQRAALRRQLQRTTIQRRAKCGRFGRRHARRILFFCGPGTARTSPSR